MIIKKIYNMCLVSVAALIWINVVLDSARAAAAGPEISVVVVVGDDIVTTLDVKNRLALAMLATGISPDEQTKQRLIPQIVQSLVNERLYLQEGKRLKISADDKDIEDGMATLAGQNDKTTEEFRAMFGDDPALLQSMEDKVLGEIIWGKIVRQIIVPKLRISDAEVDEVIEQMSTSHNQQMVGIEQILLTVDEKTDAKKSEALAENLVSEIRKGVSFTAISQQFSSAKIEHSNDVVWVSKADLDKNLVVALKGLKDGDVSDPVRTADGFLIVKFHGIKEVVNVHGDNAQVTMKQLFLSLPEDSKDIPALKQKLEALRAQLSGCDSYDKIDEKSIEGLHIDNLTIGINAIHPELRSVVESQAVGKPGDVITTTAGLHVVTVCERSLPERQLPDRTKIMQMVQMKKVELKAKHYLRDLRRKTFIEIKE